MKHFIGSECFTENDHAAEELLYSLCMSNQVKGFLPSSGQIIQYVCSYNSLFGVLHCFIEMVVLTSVKTPRYCFLKRFIHLPVGELSLLSEKKSIY